MACLVSAGNNSPCTGSVIKTEQKNIHQVALFFKGSKSQICHTTHSHMYMHYNRGEISGQVYAPYIVMLDLSHNPFTHVSALHPMLSDQLSDSCTKVSQSTIDLKIVIIIRFCMANEVNGGYFNQYYNMNIFSYISYFSSLGFFKDRSRFYLKDLIQC